MSKPKPLRSLALPLLLCLPLSLTSCAGSNDAPPPLPPAPVDLTDCVAVAVPPIPGAPGTSLTLAQIVGSLAEQRVVALAKDRCAKAWAAFYAGLGAAPAKQ